MSLPTDLLAFLSSAVRDIQSIRYSQLASGTVILYDHLITFGDEVELIWNTAWSPAKVLFMLNRYYILSSVIVNNYALFSPTLTDSFCLRFFHWQGTTGLIAVMLAEIILQMRLYALYSLDKRVLALMSICFFLTSAASGAVMGSVLSAITANAVHVIPGKLVFCVPHNISEYFWMFWVPMLMNESLLCGLALFRGFQAFTSSSPPFRSGRHLVEILIRDSVFYFVIMFATYLTNLLVWIFAPVSYLEIPIGFSVALSCVMGNRLILNVRRMNQTLAEQELPTYELGETSMSTRHGSTRLRSIVIQSGRGTLTNTEMDQLRSLRVVRYA